jgi:hypothetical protein
MNGRKAHILTGGHAWCLRAQSRDAQSVGGKVGSGSVDVQASHGLGQKVGDFATAGDVSDLDEALRNEISDEMQPKIHMFGSEPILTDLTEC